jgi:hypothetical protein
LLPVSGLTLALREPTGDDELFLVETQLAPLPALLELLARVATLADGRPLDPVSLPVADLDAAALIIRRHWVGETIATDVACPVVGCGERIDIEIGIDAYLDYHRPRRPRRVTRTTPNGWFALGDGTRFRIPTVADLLAAPTEELLAARCVDAPQVSRALAARLDRALTALAPRLDGAVGGACPACSGLVSVRFEPLPYVLDELANVFAAIHIEAHALAYAYGWPEATILALPRARRQRYATIIAGEGLAA